MLEFKINNFITLKLENGKTNIYVGNKLFLHCKFILLNIPLENISTLSELESIDEIMNSVKNQDQYNNIDIPPEVKFWVHCSNMQVWVENNYDTCLLEKNLAFPLLKELTDLGDKRAKQIFKEEIVKRFKSGFFSIIQYLTNQGYLRYLNDNELSILFDDIDLSILDIIDKKNSNKDKKHIIYLLKEIEIIYPKIFEVVAYYFKKNGKEKQLSDILIRSLQENHLNDKPFIFDLQDSYLNIIQHFNDPLIIINFLNLLIQTGFSEFAALLRIISNENRKSLTPSKPMILYLGKILIMIKTNPWNLYEKYFRLIFDYIKSIYNKLFQQYKSSQREIFFKNVANFFKLFWTLILIIPKRVDEWISKAREKYGLSYKQAFQDSYQHVTEHEIILEYKNNRININIISSYIERAEKELINSFNNNISKK